MSPSSRASTSKMIGTWMPRMSNCPVIWVVTTPPSVKATGNGRASSRVKVAMGSLGNICSRIYRSRLGWSLSSRCRSISITEGRPSRCTSPERAIVRTTASLGSGSRASFSSTVNGASEPSPTTNVIPSICPKSLCSSVSEIGLISPGAPHPREPLCVPLHRLEVGAVRKTVNGASEPSPTTNVIPSICPKSLCFSIRNRTDKLGACNEKRKLGAYF